MAQYSLLLFIILSASLRTVYCVPGNDSFNSFGPKIAKKTESKNTEHSTEKRFFFENHDAPLDEKTIEKRRLLFSEGDVNSPVTTEYFERRRTNYSETENDNRASEYQQGYGNWENTRNRLYLPIESGNSRNFSQIHPRRPFPEQINEAGQVQQANQNYNWKERNNFFGKSRSLWDKENIFRQNANPEYDLRIDHNYKNRPAGEFNNLATKYNTENRHSDMFNRRVSITTFDDAAEVQNAKSHNDERGGEMNPGYTGFPNVNYYNKYPKKFYNQDFFRPEKGVVINLNTECPTPKEYNSRLVHKFFLTPTTPINTPEVSSFSIPETTLISTQKMTPMYYW